jgi:hypothetical protein
MTQPVMKRRNIKNKNKSHAVTVATKIAWIFFLKKPLRQPTRNPPKPARLTAIKQVDNATN